MVQGARHKNSPYKMMMHLAVWRLKLKGNSIEKYDLKYFAILTSIVAIIILCKSDSLSLS